VNRGRTEYQDKFGITASGLASRRKITQDTEMAVGVNPSKYQDLASATANA